MNLALRDQQIFQLKAELENRKRILCVKRQQLKSNMRENDLLREVAEDYDNYNKHIIDQKEKQIVFLKRLNDYIEDISVDLKLTDNKLKESKQEQREIMKEISFLKSEIDDLVENNEEDINSSDNIDE